MSKMADDAAGVLDADDAHSTPAKVAALQIVTLLQARYDLTAIETDDLTRIARYIDDAITDARRLDEMKTRGDSAERRRRARVIGDLA